MSEALRDYIRPEHVRLHLEGTDKLSLVRELIGVLVESGAVRDAAEVEQAVRSREDEMSTGLHDGIAMPHCKSRTVSDMQVAIGLKREGVEFSAVDGMASRIFILLVCPENQPAKHIRFITAITRRLRDPAVRQALVRATSVPEVLVLLAGADS